MKILEHRTTSQRGIRIHRKQSIAFYLEKLYIILCLLCMTSACDTNTKLQHALKYAGENRAELEKVLQHYENDPNPLKLCAAIFLIENMPGHRTLAGEEVATYYQAVNSVLSMPADRLAKKAKLDSITDAYPGIWTNVAEDIHVISAEYLVKSIDLAFRAWEGKPHARHLDFEQFREFLLPYKCAEFQQLDGWRDSLCRKFDTVLDKDLYSDQYHRSVYRAATLINQHVKQIVQPLALRADRSYLFLDAASLARTPLGECGDFAILCTAIMRSEGIAAAVDYFPCRGKGGNGHAWFTLLNNNGEFMSCIWNMDSKPGDVAFPEESFPKVYRHSYIANPRVVEYLRETTYKQPMFDMFQQDVTREYVRASDLEIPVFNTRLKDKYVYIAAFNERAWHVVDFGIVKRGKARFTNIGREVAYIVMGYDGNALVPVSDPFLVHEDGRVELKMADASCLRPARLTRKYPKSLIVAVVEQRLVGGKIEASNSEDFSPCVTLYAIDSLLAPDLLPLADTTKYRYWRFYSPPGKYCNIAELQFYEAGCDTVARGRVIGTEKIHGNNPAMSREKAFDGDWLTSFHSGDTNGGWVGLDLGAPACVDRVRCVPRSDDNGIHFGDRYELKYWGQGGWQSLGSRVAQDNVLYYENIPGNALLLLQNHTRGKQERPFVLENGKQVWW